MYEERKNNSDNLYFPEYEEIRRTLIRYKSSNITNEQNSINEIKIENELHLIKHSMNIYQYHDKNLFLFTSPNLFKIHGENTDDFFFTEHYG
jgi:hypothetical protein